MKGNFFAMVVAVLLSTVSAFAGNRVLGIYTMSYPTKGTYTVERGDFNKLYYFDVYVQVMGETEDDKVYMVMRKTDLPIFTIDVIDCKNWYEEYCRETEDLVLRDGEEYVKDVPSTFERSMLTWEACGKSWYGGVESVKPRFIVTADGERLLSIKWVLLVEGDGGGVREVCMTFSSMDEFDGLIRALDIDEMF